MKRAMIVGLVVLAVTLSGCGGSVEETAIPEVELDFVPVVSVTGEVVPEVWADISAQTGGTVMEVVVEPGSQVTVDQVLIQLDPTDAQLTVQQAEGALAAAQAQLASLEGGARPEDIAIAEARLEGAQAAVAQAIAQRDQLAGTGAAAAQAELAAARVEERGALDVYQQYGWRIGEPATLQLRAAEAARAAAEAHLDEVGEDGAQIRAADAAVWAAAAQRDIAQAQLDMLQRGATREEIAAAQAAVAQAEAALEAARVALARCEVRAPFAGTVGVVYVRAGELVVPGQPLLALGDLTTLRVETTDLDEIDVARVEVGQEAAVTFDALPEQVYTGRVVRISPMAEPGTGGVHYTVVVELEEIDPAIRWGMTAFVDVEVEE